VQKQKTFCAHRLAKNKKMDMTELYPSCPFTAKDGGRISIIMGPMFSGKTTELLRRVRRHSVARNNVLIIKHGRDTRYSPTSVMTHEGDHVDVSTTTPALQDTVLSLSSSSSSSPSTGLVKKMVPPRTRTALLLRNDIAAEDIEWAHVIGIDEGQFYEDLVEFCHTLAQCGKICLVAALDGDFRRRPFGHVLELVPFAEEVIKLQAVCMQCHQETAAFSKRITSQVQTQELIGGADHYIACCRSCWSK
jgi:thymidine kinase